MSVQQDVEFHQGETWRMYLSCHNADGTPMVFDIDTDVQFRITGDAGVLITLVRDHGIVVTDEAAGLATIEVKPIDQEDNGLMEADTYAYEIRVITDAFVSIQANGKFRVRTSLFAVP